MKNTVVSLQNVGKSYEGTDYAVKDLNLTVKQGEIVSLLGPSGCGKTTTLRLIAGLERQEEGAIYIDSKEVSQGKTFVSPEKRGVAMVFQDYALFPHINVIKNIEFGLRKLDGEEKKRRVAEVLAMTGLGGLEKRFPHELSGGQQQRVALARALAQKPLLLLLDEPFSGLDADMRIKVRQEVNRILKAAGITAIIVTHDQDEAFSMSDKVALLNGGRIEQVGTPEDIYHKPETRFVADFVGESAFIKGEVVAGGVETELGFLKTSLAEEEGALGKPVEIMIRADDIEMKPHEEGNCYIEERIFKGSVNLYALRLSSGREVLAVTSSTNIMSHGIRAEAKIDPRHIVCFKPHENEKWHIYEGVS